MEKSCSAKLALMYQMVNLNISNITVQVHKAGLSFSGARLTLSSHYMDIAEDYWSGDQEVHPATGGLIRGAYKVPKTWQSVDQEQFSREMLMPFVQKACNPGIC